MKKRIISATLATICAISAMATSASAAKTAADATLNVSGSTNVPKITIEIPTAATYVANPYKLDVVVGKDNKDKDVTGNDQIISAGYNIINKSPCGVKISMAAAASKPPKGVTLSDKEVSSNEKTKMYYLKAAVAKSNDNDVEKAEFDFDKATSVAITGTKAADFVEVLTLDAYSTESKYEGIYLGQVKILGNATAAPETAWTSEDKIDVTLTFKFDIAPGTDDKD